MGVPEQGRRVTLVDRIRCQGTAPLTLPDRDGGLATRRVQPAHEEQAITLKPPIFESFSELTRPFCRIEPEAKAAAEQRVHPEVEVRHRTPPRLARSV